MLKGKKSKCFCFSPEYFPYQALNLDVYWLSTRMHSSRMRTVLCREEGLCLPRDGGGCLQRGVLAWGCVPQHALGRGDVCGQNSWHMLVKTLPFHNYVADSKNKTCTEKSQNHKYITVKIIRQQIELFELNQRDVFPARDFALSEGWQAWCSWINHLVCLHTRGSSSTCQERENGMWTGWQMMNSLRRYSNANRHVGGF